MGGPVPNWPPLPPLPPYQRARMTPRELIQAGFWLAIGCMAASVVVTVVIVVGLMALGAYVADRAIDDPFRPLR